MSTPFTPESYSTLLVLQRPPKPDWTQKTDGQRGTKGDVPRLCLRFRVTEQYPDPLSMYPVTRGR